jgi:hypothetical protein
MRNVLSTLWGVMLTVPFSAGCVGASLFGIPLGPQVANGLLVSGAVAPTVGSAGGCSYTPVSPGATAGAELLHGIMELGPASKTQNEYVAVANVQNQLTSTATAPNCPNYDGRCTTLDSNTVELVAAHVTYEYPVQPGALAERFKYNHANEPLEGLLSGVSTIAVSNLTSGSVETVPVTLITRPFSEELLKDAVVLREIRQEQGFTVIARAVLEGRTGSGGRVTSNEFIFRVILVQGRLQNCDEMASICEELGQLQSPPVVMIPTLTGQCWPDQDIPECVPVGSVSDCQEL